MDQPRPATKIIELSVPLKRGELLNLAIDSYSSGNLTDFIGSLTPPQQQQLAKEAFPPRVPIVSNLIDLIWPKARFTAPFAAHLSAELFSGCNYSPLD